VPAAAAALVAELTAKDPAARPHDAAAVAARAGQLRDFLTGGAPTALAEIASGPVPYPGAAAHPVTLVEAQPLTWHDAHAGPTYRPATRASRQRRGGRSRRGALLAAAGVALLAGLGAWLLAATMPAVPTSQPGPSAQASHPASAPTVQTVDVNGAALIGQPVSAVSQQLSQLGLTPAISWTASEQDPGTVLSVQPNGPVPAGSTVTVVAAFPEFGFGHGGHHGGGLGDGGDQGD
jgi:eukaryotic-like serine/threonine-protein kinase